MPLSDQIRQVIDTVPMSRYAICKAIGLNEATMSRFMAGEAGLSMKVLDRLADYLDLHIAAGDGHDVPATAVKAKRAEAKRKRDRRRKKSTIRQQSRWKGG